MTPPAQQEVDCQADQQKHYSGGDRGAELRLAALLNNECRQHPRLTKDVPANDQDRADFGYNPSEAGDHCSGDTSPGLAGSHSAFGPTSERQRLELFESMSRQPSHRTGGDSRRNRDGEENLGHNHRGRGEDEAESAKGSFIPKEKQQKQPDKDRRDPHPHVDRKSDRPPAPESAKRQGDAKSLE